MKRRPVLSFSRLAAFPAALAAVSMVASPVLAAPLPTGVPQGSFAQTGSFDAEAVDAHNHRRGGYDRYRHRRGGTDLGDILTGVLVIGGIAAVAGAATSASRDGYRYRDARYPQQPYSYRARGDDSWREGSSIDRSVDLCIREVEREVRVAAVDSVDRTLEGWRIAGTLYDGSDFTCSIDRTGRVNGIQYGNPGGSVYALPSADDAYGAPYQDAYADAEVYEDRQHDEEIYRQARLRADSSTPVLDPVAEGPMPAYPGGPLPGDEYERGDEPFLN